MSIFAWNATSQISLATVKSTAAQKEQTEIGNIGTRKSTIIISHYFMYFSTRFDFRNATIFLFDGTGIFELLLSFVAICIVFYFIRYIFLNNWVLVVDKLYNCTWFIHLILLVSCGKHDLYVYSLLKMLKASLLLSPKKVLENGRKVLKKSW